MASMPLKDKPASPAMETVEQHFRRLEAAWNADTSHLSSATKIMEHPAFREIVGMGASVVPLMLRDLEKRPSLWVWALPDITGIDPVPEKDRGYIAKMTEAWLRWGREQGYLQ